MSGEEKPDLQSMRDAVAKLAKTSADLQTTLREVEDLRAQVREAKGSLEQCKPVTARFQKALERETDTRGHRLHAFA